MEKKIENTVEVTIDMKNKIISVVFLTALYDDDQNSQQARAAVKKVDELIKDNKTEKYKVRVDLRPMVDKAHLSSEAKIIYKNFVLSDLFEKVAVIGSTDSQTSIANFILKFFDLTLHKKLSWFSEAEEADIWLKS